MDFAPWRFFCVAGSSLGSSPPSRRWPIWSARLFGQLGMPGERPGIVILPGMLTLETNLNEGALFGMGQGMGRFFAAVSVVAIIGILGIVSRPAARSDLRLLVALGLITGGILGNLYDRLGLPGLTWHAPLERLGTPVLAVRDWIHFKLDGIIDWPIFNLADSWLVIGAGLLLLVSLYAGPEEESPAGPAAGGETK
jgi:signal peptidase II